MALSRQAQEYAAEIRLQDWSDSPWRRDRAGHNREHDSNRGDKVLTSHEADAVRMNVMWVAAQALRYNDPNLDLYEFAEACGVSIRTAKGRKNDWIEYGLRFTDGRPHRPGTYEPDPAES